MLNRELSSAYQSAVQGAAPAWSPLPLQYADYACWQADWLASGELARQLEFWREELKGAPPLLALPVDQPREMESRSGSVWRQCTLPPHSLAALHALARRQGCTLFMLLLAAAPPAASGAALVK